MLKTIVSPLWYPYTQMKWAEKHHHVESAKGVYLHLSDGKELIDAISSWWCVIHGYNHPRLNRAVTMQLEKMSHVMLGGLTHEPALKLAEKLVDITPKGLNHVFFSDSGSVGVEVALKMAIQYWWNQNERAKSKFLALKHAYHGDTTGAMSVGDPEESMHVLFSPLLPRHYFLDTPSGREGQIAETSKDIEKLEQFLKHHHQEIAAFILEPLVQCAGGFKMYSSEYLKSARNLCDQYNILFIFDEVATGFGRTGTLFAADKAQVTPDIMILGKGLTGGYTGLAATVATTGIFEAFFGNDLSRALMHGPTFTGNPLACAAALESTALFFEEAYLDKIAAIERQLATVLYPFHHPKVKETRVLGAIGVIEVYDPKDVEGIQEFAAERGVWLRPFGNIIYAMPPYIISQNELSQIMDVMVSWFHKNKNNINKSYP